ncbi:hypothetical protein LJD47_25675, partial [Escherichia coli]|nr:hypothetical protein [Escherichia coli]
EQLNFRFAVASSQILQKKVSEARATYQDILAKDQTSFEAQAWIEALAHVGNDETGAALAHQALAGLDRDRAEAYRQRFVRAEQIIADKPNADVPELTGKVMIVALGYALAKDGTMEKPLIDRLDV